MEQRQCLPKKKKNLLGLPITISRESRCTTLVECGLIGKMHLTNEMSEEDVKCELGRSLGSK